jgi:hypothetical protein
METPSSPARRPGAGRRRADEGILDGEASPAEGVDCDQPEVECGLKVKAVTRIEPTPRPNGLPRLPTARSRVVIAVHGARAG